MPPVSDLEATALFEQAESVETSYFAEGAGKIAFEKFAKKLMGLPVNDAVVADAARSIEAFFDVAERLLCLNDYMAGNQFTLMDIFYIPIIERLFVCGYGDSITSRKAVSAWWNRCTSRPAVKKLFADNNQAAINANKQHKSLMA